MGSSLQAWIDHIFRRPIGEPAWYWSDDAELWTGPREQIPLLIEQTLLRISCGRWWMKNVLRHRGSAQ